jgi:hypothetical protein
VSRVLEWSNSTEVRVIPNTPIIRVKNNFAAQVSRSETSWLEAWNLEVGTIMVLDWLLMNRSYSSDYI